jgi:predicted RNA-binding protein with PIN domain
MSETLPALPEQLLLPVLDTAGDLLKTLAPADVPPLLRPLAGFDRRGLARGAARQTLLKALESDETFRERSCERFVARPEVAALLEQWSTDKAGQLVTEAADRSDLPLLASSLYAAKPDGWEFGLGATVAAFDLYRREQAEADDVKALQTQQASLEEARKRAEVARDAALAEAARLDRELKEERRTRRTREEKVEADAATAVVRVQQAEAELAAAKTKAEGAKARSQREAERTRKAEQDARELKTVLAVRDQELATALIALERAAAPGTGLRYGDLRALADAAELARRLAVGLGGVVEHARRVGGMGDAADDAPVPAATPASRVPARAPTSRAKVEMPAGMLAESPDAVIHALRSEGVALVVDGYNVSMEGWSDCTPAVQRDRLMAALAELHLRTKCPITLVFDGDGTTLVNPPRRAGVRIVFSAAGEEADEVVVREIAALPARVPVLAVSSDTWVRTHAEAEGAHVLPSHALLRVLRA